MQKYQIIVLDQVFNNLQETLNYIKKDSVPHAIKFRSGVLDTIEQLEYFPESGKNLIDDLKAKVYKGRLIVYIIDNKQVVEKLREKKAFRQDFVYSAPVIIVCCGDPNAYIGKHGGEYQIKEGSVPKDEKKREELFSVLKGKELLRVDRDISIASAFMVLRATELGLGTSFIGLINESVLSIISKLRNSS